MKITSKNIIKYIKWCNKGGYYKNRLTNTIYGKPIPPPPRWSPSLYKGGIQKREQAKLIPTKFSP